MQIEIKHLENAGVGKIGDVNDLVPVLQKGLFPFRIRHGEKLVGEPTIHNESRFGVVIPILLVLRLELGKRFPNHSEDLPTLPSARGI